MQDKINQIDENYNRHGYWETDSWIANYVHGELFGYSEEFDVYLGHIVEYHAR